MFFKKKPPYVTAPQEAPSPQTKVMPTKLLIDRHNPATYVPSYGTDVRETWKKHRAEGTT